MYWISKKVSFFNFAIEIRWDILTIFSNTVNFAKGVKSADFTTYANISRNKTSVKAMSSKEHCNKTSCVFQDTINKQKYRKIVVCLENCYPKMSKHLIQVPQDFKCEHSKVSKTQFLFKKSWQKYLNFNYKKIEKKIYFLIFEFSCQK